MKLLYYIRRFWEIPGVELKYLFICIFYSIVISLLVYSVPVKYYLFLLNKMPKYKSPETNNFHGINLARKTINRIGLLLPFKLTCFSKAIIFKLIMNHFGIHSKIFLVTLKGNSEQLLAHALISIDNKIVYLNNYKEYKLVWSFG